MLWTQVLYPYPLEVLVNANVYGSFGIDFTLEDYNLDPHPSAEGHTLIASLIKQEMNSIQVPIRKALPENNIEFRAENFFCKLVSSNGNKTVKIIGVEKSTKTIVIPDTIVVGGYEF